MVYNNGMKLGIEMFGWKVLQWKLEGALVLSRVGERA